MVMVLVLSVAQVTTMPLPTAKIQTVRHSTLKQLALQLPQLCQPTLSQPVEPRDRLLAPPRPEAVPQCQCPLHQSLQKLDQLLLLLPCLTHLHPAPPLPPRKLSLTACLSTRNLQLNVPLVCL